MSKVEDLYSQKIMALAMSIPSSEPIEGNWVTKRSPICGSEITVGVRLDRERVSSFSQKVRACTLGQASAAIFAKAVIGCNRTDIAALRRQVAAMLSAGDPPPGAPFGDYATLSLARDYPNRHPAILLVIDATLAAIDEAVN